MGGGKDKDKHDGSESSDKGLFSNIAHGLSGYPPGSGYPAAPGAYPPQGYPPAPGGYPPQGYPPQGYPPQGYPPQGYPPQGYPPAGYPGHSASSHGKQIIFSTLTWTWHWRNVSRRCGCSCGRLRSAPSGARWRPWRCLWPWCATWCILRARIRWPRQARQIQARQI
ncbi:hypothetical protein Taro_019028 [Colocasia esculenta]|uniref:Rhodopsin n=1 Tax=Colocasia esculenta TaxID=4460 RepID=A0A843UVJ0_COLES|nr:hypothetical protein [Colocasia esculenta]